MNRAIAFQVTIWKNSAVQEVKEVSALYLILPAIGILISIAFGICLLLLFKKEIDISKRKRSDISPADRTKAVCFMGSSLIAAFLMLIPFAKLGSFAGSDPLKTAGYALVMLLRYSGPDFLLGAVVLVLHYQNVKKLAQPAAPEQQELQPPERGIVEKASRGAACPDRGSHCDLSGLAHLVPGSEADPADRLRGLSRGRLDLTDVVDCPKQREGDSQTGAKQNRWNRRTWICAR